MLRAALILALTALPVTAQDWSTVEFMTRKLDDPDHGAAYRAAVAACLAGRGDPAATAALFLEGNWVTVEEREQGLMEIFSPDADLYVLAADDGSFCAAYSEVQGTATAIGNLQIIGGAAGLSLESLDMPAGCIAFALGHGIQAEVTSSGNDPVCESETTSSVRFIFGGAG
ncbi:hypothetical protein G5B31_17480 [Rhodobacter sp. SGA-6-6]|uniref:hypothetical protein n=1 Tax=Rhodobacter sp. SGA-6-6 TaxID=2710882 RepID=UPI0013ED4D49|nr:hypothetical protein [Rhodobacter sp. SGA-6-6]NGM47332.1 hypothetical protein [Rhodobacter sp. SGA-6-6]